MATHQILHDISLNAKNVNLLVVLEGKWIKINEICVNPHGFYTALISKMLTNSITPTLTGLTITFSVTLAKGHTFFELTITSILHTLQQFSHCMHVHV